MLSRCDVDIAITEISTVVILLKLHEIKMLIAKTLVLIHCNRSGLHLNYYGTRKLQENFLYELAKLD